MAHNAMRSMCCSVRFTHRSVNSRGAGVEEVASSLCHPVEETAIPLPDPAVSGLVKGVVRATTIIVQTASDVKLPAPPQRKKIHMKLPNIEKKAPTNFIFFAFKKEKGE